MKFPITAKAPSIEGRPFEATAGVQGETVRGEPRIYWVTFVGDEVSHSWHDVGDESRSLALITRRAEKYNRFVGQLAGAMF